MDLTKLSFGFTPEDMAALEKYKAILTQSHGPISNVIAIRTAIRESLAARSAVVAEEQPHA